VETVQGVAFEAVPDAGAAAVVVRGEFDMGDVSTFFDAFEVVRSSAPDLLIVDLTELTFIGSSGLSALLEAIRRHPRVVLRGAPRAFSRVVEVAGLVDTFELEAGTHAPVGRFAAGGD
jgi:anti-sigma B factor antagonist